MLGKRLQIIAATSLVLAVIIPVWWHTTAVHREYIPVDDINLWKDHQKWELFWKLFKEHPPGFQEKVAKVSPGYSISFTLANADPNTILPRWDFSAVQDYFAPVLERLSVVADFTVDSQVLHYASLLESPKFDSPTGTYYIPETQITQYLNPNEWKPEYSATTLPTLNFIIYIPNKKTSPLKIRLTNGTFSPTNSVLLPQWGGISIYNPQLSDSSNLTRVNLGCEELVGVLPIMAGQLNQLMGTKFSPKISKADYSALVKMRLSENIHTSTQTILSLNSLIESLPQMVVLEHISTLVQESIDNLNKAHDALQKGDYESSLRASREALRASEKAFFDPSMLALLYFPDEHKYAIYTPLFLPVVFPIFAALMQEIKDRKAKRKEKERLEKERKDKERAEKEQAEREAVAREGEGEGEKKEGETESQLRQRKKKQENDS